MYNYWCMFRAFDPPNQTLTDSSIWQLNVIAPVCLGEFRCLPMQWVKKSSAVWNQLGVVKCWQNCLAEKMAAEIAMRKMARDIHAGENSFIHSKFSEVWIKRFTAAKPAESTCWLQMWKLHEFLQSLQYISWQWVSDVWMKSFLYWGGCWLDLIF